MKRKLIIIITLIVIIITGIMLYFYFKKENATIVSYSIQGNEITLNIETKSYGQILDVAYYYFVLKMPK